MHAGAPGSLDSRLQVVEIAENPQAGRVVYWFRAPGMDSAASWVTLGLPSPVSVSSSLKVVSATSQICEL